MNGYLFSFAAFFISVLFLDESSCHKKANGSSGGEFFPLAEGNYWVYIDSSFTDGKLVSVTNDTDRVTKESTWNGTKTYVLDDGKELFLRNDTVYQLSMQRTGFKFPSPIFIASEKESEFNYIFGGDVVMRRKAMKLSSCPESKYKSAACYKISDDCNGYSIVGYGVGVIRERSSDCLSGKDNYATRTLIGMSVSGGK